MPRRQRSCRSGGWGGIGSLINTSAIKMNWFWPLSTVMPKGFLTFEIRSPTCDVSIAPAVEDFVGAMMAAHAVDPKLHRVCVEQILNLGLDHLLTMRTTAVHLVSAYLHSKKSEIDIDDIETAAYVLVVTVDSVIHSAFLGDIQPDLDRLSTQLVRLILRYLGVAESV